MKNLPLILLGLIAWALTACGAPFQANFSDLSEAGSPAIGSGAGSGGASSAAGAGVAPDPMAGAGEGGAAGAAADPGLGDAGVAGSGGAPPVVTDYFCSAAQEVTGGYQALSPGAACLRTKEAINTVGCAHWDNRALLVNGVPATCGVPQAFPVRADGFTYLTLGPGSSGAAAIRWFLSDPAPDPCAARTWQAGDLYAPGEIMLDACDAPGATGSAEACTLGTVNAWACSGLKCTSVQPGGNDWASTWRLVTTCG